MPKKTINYKELGFLLPVPGSFEHASWKAHMALWRFNNLLKKEFMQILKVPNFIARHVLENAHLILDTSALERDGEIAIHAYANGQYMRTDRHTVSQYPFQRVAPFKPAKRMRNAAMTGKEKRLKKK